MLKNLENNGTEEIGLVTPIPDTRGFKQPTYISGSLIFIYVAEKSAMEILYTISLPKCFDIAPLQPAQSVLQYQMGMDYTGLKWSHISTFRQWYNKSIFIIDAGNHDYIMS